MCVQTRSQVSELLNCIEHFSLCLIRILILHSTTKTTNRLEIKQEVYAKKGQQQNLRQLRLLTYVGRPNKVIIPVHTTTTTSK